MNNIEKEPTDKPEPEKGEVFENYESFYSAYEAAYEGVETIRPIVRIYNKRMGNEELVDAPSGFVDARAHKITDHQANMNVYEERKLIAWFRLNNENISQFRIEIIQKHPDQ